MANRTLIASPIILATCSLVAQKEWSFPHVTGGQVLFRTPAGSWDAGTYRLEVNTEAGLAALPTKLE